MSGCQLHTHTDSNTRTLSVTGTHADQRAGKLDFNNQLKAYSIEWAELLPTISREDKRCRSITGC